MKRIIFLFFFIFLFLFIGNHNVYASCNYQRDTNGNCFAGTDCARVRQGSYTACCDTPAECTTALNNTPTMSKNPPGTTAPTNTATCVSTAIGCIDVSNANALTASILRLGIGLGGGIAFILMLAAVFMIMTSAGDPKRMQAGQELITSALMGLLLIIFSVFLLQFIGVTILDIPGFSK